jgi:hypothetical protein
MKRAVPVRREGGGIPARLNNWTATRGRIAGMAELKPPVLIIDFHYAGRRDEHGVVYLRRKGGEPSELSSYVNEILQLQHAELHDGMKVWLVDLDRDISGKDGAPLAATIRWHDDSGWTAEYVWDDAESLE